MADCGDRTQERSYEEDSHVLPNEPEQQHPSESQVAVSRADPAPRGSYARSRAGWASKERSTPEDMNLEEHAWRFHFSFPQPVLESDSSSGFDSKPQAVPRKRKPPEVRNALREKRLAQRQKASRHHAELALRKYNRANNTKVSFSPSHLSWWRYCYHYNFTAKPEGHHSADGGVKLFFSEVNGYPRSENDVLLCCIVGEEDAGHCYGCEGDQPMMVHPSSHAYGGGNSTAIEMPGSDGSSSDSD